MNGEQYEELKGRYNFDEWRDRNRLDENLFIWRFLFKGDEFPDWQPQQIRELGPPPGGERLLSMEADIGEAPRLIQSIWRPSKGRAGAAFSIDSYECASRAASHELLIRILAEFQSPLIARQPEAEVGDVTFVHPGNNIILFARANHAVVIRSMGATTISVSELASQFDSDLIEKPQAQISRMEPNIRTLRSELAELQVGAQAPLEIDASLPSGQPLMYKFFSRAGEVLMKEGKLLYVPTVPGEQDLDVYAIAPDRGVGTGKIEFSVR